MHTYTEQEALNLALGQGGYDIIDSSNGAITGKNYVACLVLQDGSFSALTATNSTKDTGTAKLLSVTLAQGMSFPLRVTAATVSSGIFMMFKG